MRSIPFWAVCGIIFVIPWEELAVVPGMETVAKSIGYAATALSLMVVLLQFRIRRPPLAFVPLGLMIAWNCLSVFWSVDAEGSMARELTSLSLLAFAWMIWEFGDSEKRILWMFRAYLFGCCVSLSTMFLAFVPGASDKFGGVERYTGGDLNPNDIAAVLNIGIALAAYLASQTARGKRMRMVYWAFVPAAMIGILLTASRMGIGVLLGNLSMIGVTVLTKGFKLLIPFILVVAVAAWMVPRFVSEKTFDRFAEGSQAGSFRTRVGYWIAGLEYWQSCPIQGVGAGAFKRVTELQGVAKPSVAHNTYVTVLVEGGLVGAILMLTFWALMLRSVWRLPKRDRLFCLTLLGIWCGVSVAGTWECNKSTWFIFGTVLAFCALPKWRSPSKPTIRVQRQPLGYR